MSQQINSIGKQEDDNSATIFFIAQKQQKNYSKHLFRFIKRNRMI